MQSKGSAEDWHVEEVTAPGEQELTGQGRGWGGVFQAEETRGTEAWGELSN